MIILGEIRTDTCRYKDTTNIGPKEEPIEDRDLKHAERQSFYCISIPGKNSETKILISLLSHY